MLKVVTSAETAGLRSSSETPSSSSWSSYWLIMSVTRTSRVDEYPLQTSSLSSLLFGCMGLLPLARLARLA